MEISSHLLGEWHLMIKTENPTEQQEGRIKIKKAKQNQIKRKKTNPKTKPTKKKPNKPCMNSLIFCRKYGLAFIFYSCCEKASYQ